MIQCEANQTYHCFVKLLGTGVNGTYDISLGFVVFQMLSFFYLSDLRSKGAKISYETKDEG